MENPTTHSATLTGAGFNDVLMGAELFDVLRINQENLNLPHVHNKLREVAAFVNDFQDAIHLIRSAVYKKPVDMEPIDHAYNYVVLQRKRLGLKKDLAQLEDEIALYE